jgi:hypothetical protein
MKSELFSKKIQMLISKKLRSGGAGRKRGTGKGPRRSRFATLRGKNARPALASTAAESRFFASQKAPQEKVLPLSLPPVRGQK